MSVQDRFPQPLEDQRAFFDELITEEWDTYRSDTWDITRRYEVARLFRRTQPRSILDIGCGCGFHDADMARYEFVERVDAIDYSEQSIRRANHEYRHPKVHRRVGDLTKAYVGPTYDLVVSFQVIEHLRTPDAYFAFVKSACRPGGAIAIFTPNAARLDNRIRRWRREPPAMLDPQHFREYTAAELRTIGERNGLAVRDSFAYLLQSLIHPTLTPRPHARSIRWGSFVPPIASALAIVFEMPVA
jgi:2-polyprenyl-3-methyl-5-hydroxy-6-metoxy-1,4-benzoquinol methylase